MAKWFEARWQDRCCVDITKELIQVIDESWAREKPVPPYYIYLKIAYHLAQEARSGLTQFRIPPEFGDRLFDYQVAAVKIAAHHLNKRGGVLIGDVVGLGKTLMATALAKVFQDDRLREWLTSHSAPSLRSFATSSEPRRASPPNFPHIPSSGRKTRYKAAQRANAPLLCDQSLQLNQSMNTKNPTNQNTTPKTKPSSWAKVGIQMIKRARVDAFMAANPHFSDRKLARLMGVSHTFVAKRRGISLTPMGPNQ